MDLLECHHGDVDEGNVVYGVRDEPRLVVQTLSVPHIITHPDSPGQEEYFSDGQTVIPPIVRALLEF